MGHKTMLKGAISHHLMGVGQTNLFRLGLKLRLGLVLLIGAGLFVACEKDPADEEIPVVIPEVPVVFSSELSGWSADHAANGSLDEGDQVGIYMIPHVAEASAAANFSIDADTASNVPYLTSGSGESVALAAASGQKAIVFPADGSPVNFVAYSPYKAGTNTVNGHVYKVDVSKQSPAKAIDLLYHKGTGTAYSKTNTNVELGFTHQLSKLKIGLVSASGTEADLVETTLMGFPSTADFKLSTGILSNLGGTDAPITLVKAADSSADQAVFEAIVVPHARNSYTRNVTFRINNTNYGYRFPASAAFKAGTVHSYNFKFTGTKVEPVQELIPFGDGGMVSWGDYQLSVGKFTFDLPATRTTGHTVKISTNAPVALTYTLSGEADSNTDDTPEWMTGMSLSDSTPDSNDWKNYVLTFNTEYNINSEAASRTGYIRLEVAGIILPVRVNQAAVGYDVREPEPASFADLVIGGKTGNTFTLATNAQDEEIAVTTMNTSLITNLTKTRSKVATDGTSTWTIGFDVTANTTTDARTGDIEVTIGGIKKTVSVSQVGVSVSEPSQTSFSDLAVDGLADNTFTIETNAPDKSIAATTKVSWIKNLTKTRSEVAADGASTWTIGFDVSMNTTTDARTGSIEVTIGGQKKTVSVSQAGVSVGEPSQTSFSDLAVGGETDNTFTIETNALDKNITATTKAAWIKNLTKTRSEVAADGSSTWTIVFDVSANTTTDARSGNIEVTIGGKKNTVPVSQVGVYVHEPSTASFPDLPVTDATGKTFTIETNSTAIIPTSLTATKEMITGLNAERSVKDAAGGVYLWTVTFNVSANRMISARSGNIEINISGIKKTIPVSQVAMYVNEPSTASFPDLSVDGATNNTFTITTNAQDEEITATTKASWITNLTKTRSAVAAADGSSTWTINFDVSVNTTTSVRSDNIEVTIGGITKTVSVSQVAMVAIYVNAPNPANFLNVIAAGATGKTFTITTNAPDESITVNCPAWITKQTPSRSEVAADGSSTWTINFDVTENTTTSARSGNIEVTIGGITNTVSVSQVAMYINEPDPALFTDLPVAGATGKTFTLETNATAIVPTSLKATDELIITNLEADRSVKDAANGIYLWTVTFDVPENATTSARSASISINIGGVTKTVSVSQVGISVGELSQTWFLDLPAAGATGKTYTIITNTPDESITVNCPAWITKQTPSRSAVAADGSSTWTINFDVTENTTTSVRSGNIEVTIGGQKKTIPVSQVAMYVNGPSTTSFSNLPVAGATGKTFLIETNSTAIIPTSLETTDESIITNLNAKRSVTASGSYLWTVTFDVSVNTMISARSASVSININGITKTVRVSQIAMYVNGPSTVSFPDLPVAGATGKTFTIETNAPDITVTTTNPSLITNLTPSRSAVAADGSSTWTINFDVSVNTTTSVRSGNIEITIGDITKTVPVSQIAMYVTEPSTASFPDLPVVGATGKTFTIETNSTAIVPTSLEATDESIITNLKAKRSLKDVVSGSYLWTVTFDVSANTTTSNRSASVSINIDGVTKTVSVSQVAIYANEPSTTSFPDLGVDGATGKTFTITTNAPDESITVTCPAWITHTKSRSAGTTDDSFIWTIVFDVSANTTISVRSASISINIGGITNTVSVSQVGALVYVNEPSTASFSDLPILGATGKTFTIETNVSDESITVNVPAWITNLTNLRSAGTTDDSFIWTIVFDATENTTTSARSGNIEVTIGGITKTVPVSQVGVYVNAPNPASIDNVIAAGAGKTFTITTSVPDESITTTNPSWITSLTKSRSAVAAADGSFTWTISFDVSANTTTSARTGDIEVTIGGIKKTIPVSQVAMYVNPSIASFPDLAVVGATGKTFTIATNAPDESITVICPAWITKQTPSRSEVAADGSSIWTISFDVTANTTTSARTGNIEVTIGGIKKTIPVSQVAMYVNAPNPASFPDLAVASATGKTFTIATNAPDESITVNVPAWITSLTNLRSAGTTDGSYIWTINFDVTENTTTSVRMGNIEVTIGGIKKTIPVSQVGIAVPSNCYIVAPGTEIYIPVSRANEHDPNAIGANDVLTAELVWTDTSSLLAEQSTYGKGATGTIRVKTAAGKSGNALVAVKVGGVIKWSWHIWVTNYNPHTNLWDPHSAGGTTDQDVWFMDRNLGAMEAANTSAGYGLYYQWGRKDPFPPNYELIAFGNGPVSLETAIQNPSIFFASLLGDGHWLSQPDDNLWGGVTSTKSIYDPCPAGFKVPLSGHGTGSPWSDLPLRSDDGITWGTSLWPNTGYSMFSRWAQADDYFGFYWSASTIGPNTYYLHFSRDGYYGNNSSSDQVEGYSVRCVKE